MKEKIEEQINTIEEEKQKVDKSEKVEKLFW